MRKSKVKGQRSMSAKIVSYGTFLSTDLGESGVIWGRVEWFRGEGSDLGESGVIQGRGEW